MPERSQMEDLERATRSPSARLAVRNRNLKRRALLWISEQRTRDKVSAAQESDHVRHSEICLGDRSIDRNRIRARKALRKGRL
jgi:hypothetical protein